MNTREQDCRQQLRDLIVEALIGQATHLKQHLDTDAELVAAVHAIEAIKRLRRAEVAAAMDAQRLKGLQRMRGFRGYYARLYGLQEGN